MFKFTTFIDGNINFDGKSRLILSILFIIIFNNSLLLDNIVIDTKLAILIYIFHRLIIKFHYHFFF